MILFQKKLSLGGKQPRDAIRPWGLTTFIETLLLQHKMFQKKLLQIRRCLGLGGQKKTSYVRDVVTFWPQIAKWRASQRFGGEQIGAKVGKQMGEQAGQ